MKGWIPDTHRSPERRYIQSFLFLGPPPVSALQISYQEGLDPQWTFFTSPAPHYPQKCLRPIPNLRAALPLPKYSPTPGIPSDCQANLQRAQISRSHQEKLHNMPHLSAIKDLLQEGNRHQSAGLYSRTATLQCCQESYLTACLKLLLVPPHESTSMSLALGPCRQGTLSLRSKKRDAPFHNFSKSQSSQQSHSHLGCAGLCLLGSSLATPQKQSILSFLFLNPRHHLIIMEINLKSPRKGVSMATSRGRTRK